MSFPIAILYTGHKSLTFIDDPKNIPTGKPFRVILTEVTTEQFHLADKVCKAITKPAES